MKKEDLQNSQQGTGSSENREVGRDAQKNQMTDIENDEQHDIAQQAGLGRDRVIDIEDLGGMSGRDDYAGSDSDDMSNQNTNEPTSR